MKCSVAKKIRKIFKKIKPNQNPRPLCIKRDENRQIGDVEKKEKNMYNNLYCNDQYTPYDTSKREKKAGIWHYIRVFCSFFSILATLSCIGIFTNYRSNFIPLLIVMWLAGVVAALLVSPAQFFVFGFGIVKALMTFAWVCLPFPLDLIPVMLVLPLSAVLIVLLLFCIPAVFTIYTYFDDLSYDATDSKKEWIAIFAGVGAALLCFGLFLGLTGIGKAVEAPRMEKSFDAYRIYSDYTEYWDRETVYTEESLSEPVSVEESAGGYVRDCRYEFDRYDGNLLSHYTVDITFDYYSDHWNITSIDEQKTPVSFTEVEGTWRAVGTYPLNLSYGNNYDVKLSFTPEGGSGTIDVTCGQEEYHLDIADIEIGEMSYYETSRYSDGEIGAVLPMKLIFSEPLSYSSWGTSYTYFDIDCVYSFDTNTISFHSFAARLMLTAAE